MQGTVFDIQHFCLHDGPGIRTVVFLKGCPLKCEWCHNPESQNLYPEIMFLKEKCIRCGECAANCPKSNFSLLNPWNCELSTKGECNKCTLNCLSGALKLCGEKMNSNVVLSEVLKDKNFYNYSGGGVTLSGGEPLLQHDFSYEILKNLKKEQIHTAIETSGFFDEFLVEKFNTVTDLWLYDIKLFEPDEHLKFTGVKNEKILKNLRTLNSLDANIILRAPIIPEVNDNQSHISKLGDLANELNSIKGIDLIPYHSLGISKAKQLGHKDIFEPDSDLLRDKVNDFFNLLCEKVDCEIKIQQ